MSTPDAALPVAVDISEVRLHFDGVRVLDGVNLLAKQGECFAVIGPNGAGKTSLVNVITGFYKPDAGQVSILGHDISADRPEDIGGLGVARTFQTPQVLPEDSALANVLLGLHRTTRRGWVKEVMLSRTARAREAQAWQAAEESLERVGLAHRAHDLASALTLGERRMLEIARAIAGSPRLLLLDEPASGLAEHEAAELIELVTVLRRESLVTVLVIEHSMSFVRRVVDRVVVLDRGAVIADDSVDGALGHPAVVSAYLGSERTGRHEPRE